MPYNKNYSFVIRIRGEKKLLWENYFGLARESRIF